ncbi:MSV199 domain [Cinara cedri]|uniref:MSV199 domain n=1 Tax=Cinara cedri TaxID=506608 RepID=A0A5E4MFR5_9HEMI|nr:MSV199 domain [Cinara cedri]
MEDINKSLTIDQYMTENKLKLSENMLFSELCTPLLNKHEILITRYLLECMGFGNNEYEKNLNDFISFLNNYDISYEQIDSGNDKINNYECIIRNESGTSTSCSKKWLILSINSFKRAMMLLNNEEILNYFLELQNTCLSYEKEKDLSELNEKFSKKMQLIEEENNELKEQTMIMKNSINNENEKKKDGYIYIATTKTYAKCNTFKIGKTNDPALRLVNFNVARNSQDLFYVCYCEPKFPLAQHD